MCVSAFDVVVCKLFIFRCSIQKPAICFFPVGCKAGRAAAFLLVLAAVPGGPPSSVGLACGAYSCAVALWKYAEWITAENRPPSGVRVTSIVTRENAGAMTSRFELDWVQANFFLNAKSISLGDG